MNKEAILEFVTDPLRLTLLIAGAVVLLVILIAGRRSKNKDVIYGGSTSRKDYTFDAMADDRLVDEEVIVLPRRKTESEAAAESEQHFSAHFAAPPEESAAQVNMQANLDVLVDTFETAPAITNIKEEPKPEPETRKQAQPQAKAQIKPANSQAQSQSKPKSKPQTQSQQQAPTQKFIALHVIAAEGLPFTGKAVFDATQSLGMAMGKHNVFHYPADAAYVGDSAFCMTNMTAEGNFDLDKLDELQTNGVSLILTLPTIYSDGVTVFSNMLAVAQALSKRLGGDIIDQSRMPLTSELVKQMRAEIQEFESQFDSTPA